MRDYNPGFKVWKQGDYLPLLVERYKFTNKQTPSAVIGDFNGDKILDIALHGGNKVICILSDDKSFKVVEVQKGHMGGKRGPLWKYLCFVPAGKASSYHEEQSLELKTDAFQICYFETASVLYYFKDGRFLKYTTSD